MRIACRSDTTNISSVVTQILMVFIQLSRTDLLSVAQYNSLIGIDTSHIELYMKRPQSFKIIDITQEYFEELWYENFQLKAAKRPIRVNISLHFVFSIANRWQMSPKKSVKLPKRFHLCQMTKICKVNLLLFFLKKKYFALYFFQFFFLCSVSFFFRPKIYNIQRIQIKLALLLCNQLGERFVI